MDIMYGLALYQRKEKGDEKEERRKRYIHVKYNLILSFGRKSSYLDTCYINWQLKDRYKFYSMVE